MDQARLEEVDGISRFQEGLFIERDHHGKIAQVYDRDLQPVPIYLLYRSFSIVAEKDGFSYKGEWVDCPDFHEMAKKRALGLQRGTHYSRKLNQVL